MLLESFSKPDSQPPSLLHPCQNGGTFGFNHCGQEGSSLSRHRGKGQRPLNPPSVLAASPDLYVVTGRSSVVSGHLWYLKISAGPGF
jgi:hypothetical protein